MRINLSLSNLCRFKPKPREFEPQASLDIPSFLAKHPHPSGRAFTAADWAWVHLTNGERGHFKAKNASPLEKKIMLFFNQLFNPSVDINDIINTLCSYKQEEHSIDNYYYVIKTALSVMEEMFPIENERTEETQLIIFIFRKALGDFKPTKPGYTSHLAGFQDWIQAASKASIPLGIFLTALTLLSLYGMGYLFNPFIQPKANINISLIQTALSINRFDIVKWALREHPIKAFDSCKDIHDFAAVLFPPYTESLPPDWENFVEQIPHTLSELEKTQQDCEAMGIQGSMPLNVFLNSMRDNSSLWVNDPLTAMREVLKFSPLFAKATDLADHPTVDVLEIYDGPKINTPGNNAGYFNLLHRIKIEWGTPSQMTHSLIFETLNAVQRKSFNFIEDNKCNLDREKFVLGTEWIETKTSNWTSKIYWGEFSKKTFLDCWKQMNKQSGGVVTHAETYRRRWNSYCLGTWIQNHPDLFQKRLSELAAAEST